MERFRRMCTIVLLALLLLFATQLSAVAQGIATWSEPFNISDSLTGSNHPTIVADAYGYVHVFWSEDMNGQEVGPDELPKPGNTIMYRRWDGQTWSQPLDVLAVASDPLAEFVAATVDNAGQLHLVWTGLTSLYYSTALASEAYSARAWSKPEVISPESARTEFESDIAVDSMGNVHIIYATRGVSAGVFHIMLAPRSIAWTRPIRISGFLRQNESAFKDVRLVLDSTNRLHAAWSTANTSGYSQAVYYAHGEQSGETWNESVMLADATTTTGFTGFPALLTYEQDKLLLIHVDQTNKGRIERTSDDAGMTWSEPRLILSSMEGVNGFLVPLLDRSDNLHLVINMRPSADQRTGIYYAPRAGLDWSPIIPVAVEAPWGPDAHFTDATVRLGNEIHVVWTELAGGEIWHVRGIINNLASLPKQPIPAVSRPADQLTDVEEDNISATLESSLAISASLQSLPSELAYPPTRMAAAWTPITVAIMPVLTLLIGVLIWQMKKR